MAAGTYKPCPGCKVQKGRLVVGSVCKDCEEALQLGRAVQAEKGRALDSENLYRLGGEWPSIYRPMRESIPSDKDELLLAFLALAKEALKPAKTKTKPYDDGVQAIPPDSRQVHYCSFDERARLFTGPKRLAEAITRLDTAVRKALLDSYHEGKIEGSNLLMQLASGNVSISELNDAHIRTGWKQK